MREHLEQIASRPDVTLLVTTHSPFLVPRGSCAAVFALDKDRDGRTRLEGQAAGDAPHASLLGGLFRDQAYAGLLERALAVPDHAQAVLLVEGLGDKHCLELAAERASRPELIADLWILPTGGTTKMVAQAVITRAATNKPVAALLDHDQPGRAMRRTLADKFEFHGQKLFSYADVFKDKDFPWEAEDLFPPALIEGFIAEHGKDAVQTGSGHGVLSLRAEGNRLQGPAAPHVHDDRQRPKGCGDHRTADELMNRSLCGGFGALGSLSAGRLDHV
ncbi:MAG: hypothetical protein ACRD0K_13410 [Egibacteraceae bacterium]